MIKSLSKPYNCPNIDGSVTITLHYIDDAKKGIKTEGIMEDCDSVSECGVKNDSGGFEWTKCPVYQKTVSEIQ